MNHTIKRVGIDIGSTTVKIAIIDEKKNHMSGISPISRKP